MERPMDGLHAAPALPQVKHVDALRPFRWLELGWDDLKHSPGPSLGHGFLLVAVGWVILFATSTHIDLVAAAVSGFLLVGPVFAAAFYELSRLRSAGQPTTFDGSLDGAARNGKSLVYLGVLLAVLGLAWVWLSGLVFERTFGSELPSISAYTWRTIIDWNYSGFYVTFLSTGAIVALVAFILSAVAAPMLFDGKASTGGAILTSIRAVAANPGAMLVWAICIAALTAIGFATWLMGLIVILPWLGHSTWHAYRDLIS